MLALPTLLLLIFLIASFALQATTNARLSNELTGVKRDYDVVVNRHYIMARGYYHSEVADVFGEYTFNIITDEKKDGHWFYSCYPSNVQETKETLAEVKYNKDRGKESHLVVVGYIKESAPIVYTDQGIGYTLELCRIMSVK